MAGPSGVSFVSSGRRRNGIRSQSPKRHKDRLFCTPQPAPLPSATLWPRFSEPCERYQQPCDEHEDVLEQLSRHRHLDHLEGDVAAVADDLRADINQLLAQALLAVEKA
jgi:hypothetical protein